MAIEPARGTEADSGPGAGRRDPRPWIALALLVAAALVVRARHLGERSLWADEIRTAGLARLPLDELGRAIFVERRDMLPAQHLATKLALGLGDGEAAVRAPSVLFGLASLVALFALGRRVFGTREALIATALLGAHHMHLAYSREARPYMLLVLFTCLCASAALSALERSSPRSWVALGLLAGAGYWCHLLIVLPLAGLATLIAVRALRPASGVRPLHLLLGLAAFGAVVAPAVAPTLSLLREPMGPASQAFLAPRAGATVLFLREPHRTKLLSALGTGTAALFPLAALLAGAGWISAWTSAWTSAGRRARAFAWLALAMVAVPLGVLSLKAFGHGFVPRYLIFLLPFLALLQARGIAALATRWAATARGARAAAWSATAALAALQVPAWYGEFTPSRRDWRGAARALEELAPAGAVVLSTGVPPRPADWDLVPECLEYYLPRDGRYALEPAGLQARPDLDEALARADPDLDVVAAVAHGDRGRPHAGEPVDYAVFRNLALLSVHRTVEGFSERIALALALCAELVQYPPESERLLARSIAAAAREPDTGAQARIHARVLRALAAHARGLEAASEVARLTRIDAVFERAQEALAPPPPPAAAALGELRALLGEARWFASLRAEVEGDLARAAAERLRARALGRAGDASLAELAAACEGAGRADAARELRAAIGRGATHGAPEEGRAEKGE